MELIGGKLMTDDVVEELRAACMRGLRKGDSGVLARAFSEPNSERLLIRIVEVASSVPDPQVGAGLLSSVL